MNFELHYLVIILIKMNITKLYTFSIFNDLYRNHCIPHDTFLYCINLNVEKKCENFAFCTICSLFIDIFYLFLLDNNSFILYTTFYRDSLYKILIKCNLMSLKIRDIKALVKKIYFLLKIVKIEDENKILPVIRRVIV